MPKLPFPSTITAESELPRHTLFRHHQLLCRHELPPHTPFRNHQLRRRHKLPPHTPFRHPQLLPPPPPPPPPFSDPTTPTDLRRPSHRPPRSPINSRVMEGGRGNVGEGGAMTLSELYKSSQKLLFKTRDGLSRLESLGFASSSSSSVVGFASVGSDPMEHSTAVRRDLSQIQSLCSEMDRLWRSIPSQGSRGLWKRKVELVTEEADSLRKNLDKQMMRHKTRMQEAKERKDLLEKANGDSSHVMRIFDEEAQAMEAAHNSSRMLDEAFETGVAILSKYADQRDRLKRAQKKALDVMNNLGLSGTVLKLIERRHKTDKWIAYGGMILVVIVVIAFYRWIH